MKTYQNIHDFVKTPFPVVTVGTFDGLHIGHQKIIRRMTDIARENNGESILLTFDPHPRLVLNNHKGDLKFINSKKRKFQLLEFFGIDHLIILPFTREFSQTPSDVFIQDYLVDKIGVKKLIVGYDHHFGRNREGNYEKLIKQGEKLGFEVEEIPAQYVDNIAVSSTKIRKALLDGNIRFANKMLGYSYNICGTVVEGNKIGRSIGFPTANIDVDDEHKLIAAGGVYACQVEIEGEVHFGMGNIGTRPTVGVDGLVTEVHIFDFDLEIYGKEISILFLDRIRNEKKFDNLDDLKRQLEADKNYSLSLLSNLNYNL